MTLRFPQGQPRCNSTPHCTLCSSNCPWPSSSWTGPGCLTQRGTTSESTLKCCYSMWSTEYFSTSKQYRPTSSWTSYLLSPTGREAYRCYYYYARNRCILKVPRVLTQTWLQPQETFENVFAVFSVWPTLENGLCSFGCPSCSSGIRSQLFHGLEPLLW